MMGTFLKLVKNPSGAVGLALLGIVAVFFLVSLVWTPYGVSEMTGASWEGPSSSHLLGTDKLGRDILTHLLVGSQVTVLTCVAASLIALLLGLILAGIIEFAPRIIALVTERMTDVLVAFPTLIIALILVTATGGSIWSSILAIGIGSATTVTRTILPELRRAASSDYVLLAKAAGAGPWWLLTRHIFPSVTPTLLVRTTQIMGIAALAEAGLSYLGLGAPLPTPTWGRMLSSYQEVIYTHPAILAIPSLAIVITILGFNLLGDGLRDVLDPRRVRNV